jgi:hypothetical protein
MMRLDCKFYHQQSIAKWWTKLFAIKKFYLLPMLLAACALEAPTPAQTPNVNLSGFPKPFQDGYRDGCVSARSFTNKKDHERFKSDGQYAVGWQDGYSACKNK